jgi:putative cardiolipin synthase
MCKTMGSNVTLSSTAAAGRSPVCRTASYLPVAIFLLTGLVCACAKDLAAVEGAPSTAFDRHLETPLGRLFEEVAVEHPGQSGFTIIRHGRPAFTARVAFADLAQQSLDLQYYIWEGDATGWILMDRLMRAADRGVQVRVLIDDISLAGRDARVAAMDAHPNIEVRVFNPFAHRGSRFVDFAIDLNRVNHRMHNKIIVVDNAAAIVGGRNIGNHYFEVATDSNFRDLDIAAAGPVVRDISDVFDYFWNGEWATPIDALVDRAFTEADLHTVAAEIRAEIAKTSYPHPLDQDVNDLASELTSIRDQFVWAPGQIVWDDPSRIREGIAQGAMIKKLYQKVDSLDEELLIESAYFVMPDHGVEKIAELTERGVRVRVLTNSMASNDVLAAHAGHAKRRKRVIESGVELYELRPDAGAVDRTANDVETKSGLHTKAVVFDRESVFIGSFNLDPRSGSINTEAGLYVESPELAEQVIAFMDEGVLPENSFRVRVDEDGDLVWITRDDGEEVRFRTDPHSSFWARMVSGFIAWLPVEHQL